MAINVSSQISNIALGIGSSRIMEADPILRSWVGGATEIFFAGESPDRLVKASNFGFFPTTQFKASFSVAFSCLFQYGIARIFDRGAIHICVCSNVHMYDCIHGFDFRLSWLWFHIRPMGVLQCVYIFARMYTHLCIRLVACVHCVCVHAFTIHMCQDICKNVHVG